MCFSAHSFFFVCAALTPLWHPSVLMLGLFLYSCWRKHKGLKEGVYHVSAHHGEWEDIRENVLNYDEEGGGEQDQVTDMQENTQIPPALLLYMKH